MTTAAATLAPFKSYICMDCGWTYDEEKGAPEEGLAPGTRWEDIPEDWKCPHCDATKASFVLLEI